MKASLLLFLSFISVSIIAQNTAPSVGLNVGNRHPHSISSDYTSSMGKMMFNFNDGQIDEPEVFAHLYLHTINMDFTITDDKLVIFYDATEKKFTLNQLYLQDHDIIIEGSALAPTKETDTDANVFLTWDIEGKPLVVILWKEYFQSSLDYKPKHKKKKKH